MCRTGPKWISSTLERHWRDIWFRRRVPCVEPKLSSTKVRQTLSNFCRTKLKLPYQIGSDTALLPYSIHQLGSAHGVKRRLNRALFKGRNVIYHSLYCLSLHPLIRQFDLHPLTISPGNMIGTVPSSVSALGRRSRRGRRLGWLRSTTTTTPRTLVQQVHLLYVNIAKTMSVAQLDLANKVEYCQYCLFRYNRCNSFLPYSSCALHPSS